MADSAMVDRAAGNGYHHDRRSETELAVVEAHGGVTAARRTEPAKNHGNK